MVDEQALVHLNGVNGETGDYGLPSMTGDRLAKIVQGEADEAFLKDMLLRHERHKDLEGKGDWGVKEGVDPTKLEEAGWGVIFAHDAKLAVKEALSPLLNLRREQAGPCYHLYEGSAGFRVGRDTKNDFLARHGSAPGPVDPAKVPYYLLIVGDPEKIPYRFQTQLGVQHAVGRIDFDDDLDAYTHYAQSVVAAETGRVVLPRQVSFFSSANDDDKATHSSHEHLVTPLAAYLAKHQPTWQTETFGADRATKAQLTRLLGGEDTPALLFASCHGMEYPRDHPRQILHQGALLCQDWPGPIAWRGRRSIPQDFYFAGDDLPDDANLLGLMGFFFACFGGGTPRLDEFSKQAFKDTRDEIAKQAFIAHLPKLMLSRPRGGALAVVAHVERALGVLLSVARSR